MLLIILIMANIRPESQNISYSPTFYLYSTVQRPKALQIAGLHHNYLSSHFYATGFTAEVRKKGKVLTFHRSRVLTNVKTDRFMTCVHNRFMNPLLDRFTKSSSVLGPSPYNVAIIIFQLSNL